jgi:preprotein translocase subunit SecG
MSWLHTVTIVLHVLLAAGIVGLVLLQRGRGAGAGAGCGAGASGTVFGARGSASFLTRATATLAALFIATSLTLTYLGARPAAAPSTSVIDRVQVPTPQKPASEDALPKLPSEAASEPVESSAPAPAPATPAPEPTAPKQ